MKPDAGADADAGKEDPARSPKRPDPLDPRNPPPHDRYCDLVLTGGVTDGVVYPWAVMELARNYRFKNIGGTSVGAMAAALTAAAEFGRRYGSVTGFNEVLLKLPDKLAEEEQTTGETTLYSLFQPQKSTRRLFDVFVSALSGEPQRRLRDTFKAVAGAALKAHRREGLCGLIIGLVGALILRADVLLGFPVWHKGLWLLPEQHFAFAAAAALTLVLALLLGTICALALIGWRIYRDLVHALPSNNFGLCTGFREDASASGAESLIEWLHRGIQGAAGKPLDQPLTFKDLWDAPGGPQEHFLPPSRRTKKSRSIDLRMVTTNLTHGRPYALPAEDQTSRLFFRIDELGKYFPAVVLDHLLKHSRPYEPKSPNSDPDADHVPRAMRELPHGDLPIVVAARLSLSFPILFSAVPLWAIDYEPKLKENRRLQKCWFSDGGICSNFPIHMFDSAVPGWPTFGISLGRRSRHRSDENIWLTRFHYQGRGDAWDRFDDERNPRKKLLGFVGSIIWSAKDWNDKTSMRMPGARDRVVHVALKQGEAGLNLKLKGDAILGYAGRYGLQAGRRLVKKFIGSGGAPSRAWNEHRWVRFNAMLVALRERIEGIGMAANHAAYAKPLADQIAQAVRKDAPPAAATPPADANAQQEPPLAEHHGKGPLLTAAQADALLQALRALEDLDAKLGQAATPQPYEPLPTPTLHLRPPL